MTHPIFSSRPPLGFWILVLVALLWILLGLPARAAVSITPDAPPKGYVTLPAALNVAQFVLTGGTGNLVNLSVSAGTATISCFPVSAQVDAMHCQNALPVYLVRAGSLAGSLSWTGTDSSATLSSTRTFTIHAISVDDTTKASDASWMVAAKTTDVRVRPTYRQLYRGQSQTLKSEILGNADTRTTWSAAAVSGASDCSLTRSSAHGVILTKPTSGTCMVTATSVDDPSKSATARINVVPSAMPYTMTADGTEPVPCEADPDFSQAVVDVGTGHAYATLAATPAPTGPTLVRIFNTSTTMTRSAYHSNFQIKTSDTRVCGVPNSLGYLPEIDCSAGATTPSWASTNPQAYAACFAVFKSGYSDVPFLTNVNVESLKIGNVHNGDAYADAAGTSRTRDDSQPLRFQNGVGINAIGNWIHDATNGIWLMDNPGFGEGAVTQNALIEGNLFTDCGNPSNDHDHTIYAQVIGLTAQYNRIFNDNTVIAGFSLKSRGLDYDIDTNYWGPGTQRVFDMVDVQGGGEGNAAALSFSDFLYDHTPTNTGAFEPNLIAARQEAFHRERIQGNIIVAASNSPGGGAYYWLHSSDDHGSAESARAAYTRVFFNTVAYSIFGISTASGGGGFPHSYYGPFFAVRYNEIFSGRGGDLNFSIAGDRNDLVDWSKNIYTAGTTDLTLPLHGGRYQDGLARGFGILDSPYSTNWQDPQNLHMLGATAANFIPSAGTTSAPTWAPVAEAQGVAAALSGEDAYDFPRYSIDSATGALTPRTLYTDAGAVQSSTPSPPPAPTVHIRSVN